MQVLAIVYAISAGVMALYFNWVYALENGFWAWVWFGEIVASFKGMFWPFFVNW